MLESATRAVDEPQTPIGELFVIVFGETIAAFLGIIITGFYSFHVWLMFKAMTTIEFCEKYLSRNGEKKTFDAATYDQGPYGNIKAVLGDNPLLFFLPINPPSGNGLTYVNEDTRLRSAQAPQAAADPYGTVDGGSDLLQYSYQRTSL